MILIDSEFKSLIPPLTSEERQGLEQSLLKEGCRDSLVLQNEPGNGCSAQRQRSNLL